MGVVSIQRQGVSDVLFIGLSDGFISVHYIIMPSQFSSIQFSYSAVSTLCDPMNRNTPGLLVRHQLPESNQTHDH